MSQKIVLLPFVAEGEFEKKFDFFFLKPVDKENVLQLGTVLFYTIFLTFLELLFSATSITHFIATW